MREIGAVYLTVTLGALAPLNAVVGAEANLLANGSFEAAAALPNATALRARGLELPADAERDGWARDWIVNTPSSPGRVAIRSGDDAPDGRRWLRVVSIGGLHIYTPARLVPGRYEWRLKARGRAHAADGQSVRPRVQFVLYRYGVLDRLTKRSGFLNNRLVHTRNLPVEGAWQSLSGPFEVSGRDLEHAYPVLAFTGDVEVDDVVVTVREDTRAPLRRTLYLSFDEGFDGETVDGTVSATVSATVSGTVARAAGRQGRGALFRRGMLTMDAEGLFDQNEGAVCFWLRPLAARDDGRAHCLFEVPVPPYNFTDSGFVVSKGFTDSLSPNLFYVISGPPWHAVNPRSVWEKGRWTHLLVTWSQSKGTLAVYRDGRLVAEQTKPFSLRPPGAGRTLVIGGRLGGRSPTPPADWKPDNGNKMRALPDSGGNFADAVLDEIQLFDRMVTPQEAWRLAGGQGMAPENRLRPLDPAPFTTLPQQLETAHIPYGKPLADGPMRALLVIPVNLARDAAELRQMLDVDADTFLLSNAARGWRTNPFHTHRHAQRFFRDVTDEDRMAELRRKVEREHEVMVLADVEMRYVPAEIQQLLLRKVQGGTGLVMTSRAAVHGAFTPEAALEGAQWIGGSVPWSGLPELFRDTPWTADRIRDRAIETFRCGEGRVALIRFFDAAPKGVGNVLVESALAPHLYGLTRGPEWDYRYGLYIAMCARAARWAARGVPACRLRLPRSTEIVLDRADLPLVQALDVGVEGTAPDALVLHTRIRDAVGRVGTEAETTPPTDGAVGLLPAGTHYLEAQLLRDGHVLDWGSIAFRVIDNDEIMDVRLRRDSLERGETLAGTVTFRRGLSRPAMLVMDAIDGADRIFARATVAIKRGRRRARFELPIDDPATIGNRVTATLRHGATVVSAVSRPFFVPRRDLMSPRSHEFPSIAWEHVTPVCAAGHILAEQVRSAGFNIALRFPVSTAMRNLAASDFAPVAYVTSIRMYANPDGTTLVKHTPDELKDHAFSNPRVQAYYWERVQKYLEDTRKYGPLFYSLGDENFYRGEMGYGPYGMAAYRQRLRERYGTIAGLNREWQSDYASWDGVPRLKVGEAKSRHHVPAMIEHRAAQERVWRKMHAHLRGQILGYDPRAKVGAEGSEARDLEAMLGVMDVWAPYSDPRQDVLMRSVAAAGHITGHWWGHYCQRDQIAAAGVTNLWGQLFRKFANASFYFSCGISAAGEGILNADGSYTDFFLKHQKADLDKIHNGVGQLLRVCEPASEGVAIHWSQTSRWGLEADDRFGTPAQADGALIASLRDLGISGWSYVTTRQLERDRLEALTGVKVVFLPVSACLSEREAEASTQYVQSGGCLVAFGPAGSRNEYGRELQTGSLDALFGLSRTGPAHAEPVDGAFTLAWPNLKLRIELSNLSVDGAVAAVPDAIAQRVGEQTIAVQTRSGRGQALWFNFNPAYLHEGVLTRVLATLFDATRVASPIRFEPAPGPRDRFGVLRNGDLTLIGVILDHRPERWNRGRILLEGEHVVYDVLEGKPLGRRAEIPVQGRPDQQSAALFALQSRPVQSLTVTAKPAQLEAGEALSIICRLDAGAGVSPKGRVVRVRCFGPDGKARRHYQRMVHLGPDGQGAVPLSFALNDTSGKWTIHVTDIATGLSAETSVTLR